MVCPPRPTFTLTTPTSPTPRSEACTGPRGTWTATQPSATSQTTCTGTEGLLSTWESNLTKVRPQFTLSHRGSDNSRLLIVFSANNIDQSISYFYATESRLNDFAIFKNNALTYLIYINEPSHAKQAFMTFDFLKRKTLVKVTVFVARYFIFNIIFLKSWSFCLHHYQPISQ